MNCFANVFAEEAAVWFKRFWVGSCWGGWGDRGRREEIGDQFIHFLEVGVGGGVGTMGVRAFEWRDSSVAIVGGGACNVVICDVNIFWSLPLLTNLTSVPFWLWLFFGIVFLRLLCGQVLWVDHVVYRSGCWACSFPSLTLWAFLSTSIWQRGMASIQVPPPLQPPWWCWLMS